MALPAAWVDPACPINWDADLNRGLLAWWLVVPNSGWTGGKAWRDLVRLREGALTGMTTAASGWRGTARPGGSGQIAFDGVDDYITVPQPDGRLTFAGQQPFTVACWHRRETGPSFEEGWKRILSVEPTVNTGWYLGITATSSGPLLAVLRGTTAFYFEAAVVPLGQWQWLVMTYDGSVLRTYQDGLLTGSSGAGGPALAASTSDFRIGKSVSDVNIITGPLDDVRLLGRAWTATEVATAYALGRAGNEGLLNRWRPTTMAAGAAVVVPPAAAVYPAAVLAMM